MSALRCFTQQSRNDIIKSIINNSTSKQSFTFSKQKRFINKNSNCPYVAYTYDRQSRSLNKGNAGFGNVQRKVFEAKEQGPSPNKYQPKIIEKKEIVNLAKGREDIKANCYINKTLYKNPGPGNYGSPTNKSVSYTMRPQTSKERNYFIKDQQQASKPGPGTYQDGFSKIIGKNIVTKFKSSALGGSLMNRSTRFKTEGESNPTSWNYQKSTDLLNKTGAKFGHENRYAFTDKTAKNSFTPGPGNYKLPSDFGHYKKYQNV